MKLISLILGAGALLASVPSTAQQRHCYVDSSGRRQCYVDSGRPGNPPPHRPPPHRPPPHRPPPHRPPPHYPPPVYRPPHRPPPHYPPPVYRPRPPEYRPPVYRPPTQRPGWDWREAQNLTWNMEIATSGAYQAADSESRYSPDSQRDWAVRKLYDLLENARQFRSQVERYPQSPTYTQYEFRNLKRAFEEAREALYWAHFSSRVDYEFDRVESAIQRLDHYYW